MDAAIFLKPGRDELAVGGYGNCRNAVINGEL